jgi:hypothetical protein
MINTWLSNNELHNQLVKSGGRMKLEKIFKYGRVAGIAGNRHTGKTNNIISLIVDFRKHNKTTKICAFGLPSTLEPLLAELNVDIVETLQQLATKKEYIIILDEFQKLKIGDRRNKEALQELMAMIYHPEQNNLILFCSPTTREYNSVIGGYIEVWLLKSMFITDTINGSQLKEALKNYKGKYYKLGYYDIPKNIIVILNNECQKEIKLDYIEEADNKKGIKSLLSYDNNNCQSNCQDKSQRKRREFIRVVGD